MFKSTKTITKTIANEKKQKVVNESAHKLSFEVFCRSAFFLSNSHSSTEGNVEWDSVKLSRRRSFYESHLLNLRIRLHLGRFIANRIFRTGDVLIKSGHGTVRFAEAASMMFVHKHTSIPVPQVLKFWSHDGWSHIAMKFVKGENLERAWSKMTENERRDILVQLRGYFNELRALEPPHPGRVEAIDGSPCYDTRLGGLYGPFEDIHSFQEHLGYQYMRDNPDQLSDSKEKFDKVAGRPYRTVFSHGDLGIYNIIVHRGKIVAIIDWEFSGWFPEYWEFTRSMDSNWRYEEVRDLIKKENILGAYPDKYECEQCLDSVFIRV